jgi:hypothetical protein
VLRKTLIISLFCSLILLSANAYSETSFAILPMVVQGDVKPEKVEEVMGSLYKFTPSWFLKGGFHYIRVDVDGEQYQIYDNGVPIGIVAQKSESTQTSGYFTVGYTF